MTTFTPSKSGASTSFKPRNIFIIANNIHEVGGLQHVVHRLAELFAEAGHNVELIGIVPYDPPRCYIQQPHYRSWVLYERDEPPAWRPRSLFDHFDLHSRLRERERRRMRADAIERLRRRFEACDEGIVIVSQSWSMQWVSKAVPRHLRVIGQSHESFEASRGLLPSTIGSQRYRRMVRHFADIDRLLLLTAVDARKFERAGFNNVGVMHNPLSFYPEHPSDLSRRTVVSVGRLVDQKRYDRLVDAFVTVADRHPDWRLRIFGDGPNEDQLRAQITRLGLSDHVELMGPTDRVEDELLNSSVFALSSEFEGLPLVLAEAMACGVPCVSFDCAPGITEIIQDGLDGLVVRNGDVAGLAEGVCRLIEDEALRRRLGECARVNIRRFSPDKILEEWHRLFDYVER